MKRGKYILIIFLIFFVLILATCVSFFYFTAGKAPTIRSNSYLELKLSGDIQEYASPDIFLSMIMGIKPLNMQDLWMNIRKAKVDGRINSLLLRIGYLQCGWGKARELREAIIDFKESGKKAYAYIEEGPDLNKAYYLATACDQVFLHPMSWLIINGIGGHIPFLKNALDKLGIEAEFEHVEEYKTAADMFTEEGFTPANKEMMESIYGDFFSQYVKEVAKARGKSEEEIKKLIDQGFFHGDDAIKAGLVDNLLYIDQVEKIILQDKQKIYRISNDQYSKIKPSSVGLNRGKKVAVIYGCGTIITGDGSYQTMGSRTISRWIKKTREDSTIAAVVFRVDSPGGSPTASDDIWRETVLTKTKKPFIVSMSDVAGSGGYWVSMSAHKIIAQPQTLTGSIGVVGGKINLSSFLEKIGITSERLIYGKRADFFSPFRSFTPEERKILKKEFLWVYDQFVEKVAEGRKMSKEDVNKLGGGRVWTGTQAKELGLIDEIGGLSRAIELAKEMAGIPPEEDVKLDIYPKKISLFQSFFGKKQVRTKLKLELGLEKIISFLELLEKEKIWAIMPIWIDTY